MRKSKGSDHKNGNLIDSLKLLVDNERGHDDFGKMNKNETSQIMKEAINAGKQIKKKNT